MKRLLLSELRQNWWLSPATLAAGLGTWALLLTITANVSTDARPAGVVFNYVSSLALSTFPLLLAASGWTASGHHGRVRLWTMLPLGRRRINLTRCLSLVCHFWPLLLTWPLIVSLLKSVYGTVPAWVLVAALAMVGNALLLSLLSRWGGALFFFFVVMQSGLAGVVPGVRQVGDAWASLLRGPWATLVLAVAAALLIDRVLRGAPPQYD